jgi:hypothetical protein
MRSGVPESNVPALQAVFLCAAHAAAARSTLMYGGAEGHATVGRMNARRALREHKAKQDHKKPWFSNFCSVFFPARARARSRARAGTPVMRLKDEYEWNP